MSNWPDSTSTLVRCCDPGFACQLLAIGQLHSDGLSICSLFCQQGVALSLQLLIETKAFRYVGRPGFQLWLNKKLYRVAFNIYIRYNNTTFIYYINNTINSLTMSRFYTSFKPLSPWTFSCFFSFLFLSPDLLSVAATCEQVGRATSHTCCYTHGGTKLF